MRRLYTLLLVLALCAPAYAASVENINDADVAASLVDPCPSGWLGSIIVRETGRLWYCDSGTWTEINLGAAFDGDSIDTCDELAAIMDDETGTCGGVVLSNVATMNNLTVQENTGIPLSVSRDDSDAYVISVEYPISGSEPNMLALRNLNNESGTRNGVGIIFTAKNLEAAEGQVAKITAEMEQAWTADDATVDGRLEFKVNQNRDTTLTPMMIQGSDASIELSHGIIDSSRSDGASAFTFDATSATHTGSLIEIDDEGSTVFTIDSNGSVFAEGYATFDAIADDTIVLTLRDENNEALVYVYNPAGDTGGRINIQDGATTSIRLDGTLYNYLSNSGGTVFGRTTPAPSAEVEVFAASGAQFRLSQDSGVDYCDWTVDGSGDLTQDCSGTIFTIDEDLEVSGDITATSNVDGQQIAAFEDVTEDGVIFFYDTAGDTGGKMEIENGSDAVHIRWSAPDHSFDISNGGVIFGSSDAPDARLELVNPTNPQLRLSDNTTNDHCDFDVDGNGDMTTDCDGDNWVFSDEVKFAITGIEFTETDTISDCSSFSATGGGIFYDDSDGEFKKCQDGVLTTLDTGGAGGGDSIEVEQGDDSGSFDAIDTTARFDDSGDVNFVFADGGAGGPDTITGEVTQVPSTATIDLYGAATPSQTANGRVVWDNDDFLLTIGNGSGRETFYPGADACTAVGSGNFKMFWDQDEDAGASADHCLYPVDDAGCDYGEVIYVDDGADQFECSEFLSFDGGGVLSMTSADPGSVDIGIESDGDFKIDISSTDGGDDVLIHSSGGPFIVDMCDGGTCDANSNLISLRNNTEIGQTGDAKDLKIWGNADVVGDFTCGGGTGCAGVSAVTTGATAWVFNASEAAHSGDLFEIQDEATWVWMINDVGNMVSADGKRWFNANGLDEGTYNDTWGDVTLVEATGTGTVTGVNAINLRGLAEFKGATGSSGTYRGAWFTAEFEPTGDNVDISDIVGAYYEVDDNSTGTGHTVNLIAQDNIVQALGAGTTTIPKMTGTNIKFSYAGTNTTVTAARGIYIRAPTAPGSGTTVAIQRAIDIEDMGGHGATDDVIAIASQSGADAGKGNFRMYGGTWNTGHIRLGNARLWFDGTDWYGKSSEPTGATDGTKLLDHFTTSDEINDLSVAVTWTNVPDANVDGSSERDEVCNTADLDSSCLVIDDSHNHIITNIDAFTITELNTQISDATLCESDGTNCDATQAELDLKANLAGPTFTGDPTAPTASAGDSDTSIATTDFVDRRKQHNCDTVENLVAADDNLIMDVFGEAVTITAVACASDAAATVVLEDWGGTAIETIVCDTDGSLVWDTSMSGTATLSAGEVMRMDTTSESTPTWTMVCWEWRND